MPRLLESSQQAQDSEGGPHGLLGRTLGVLELLAANARGLQLYAIADRLRIPRSATHRVLASLIERGYVRQERHQGAYQLTARIASLAFTFLSGSGVTDLAQPILDDLALQSSELVRLALIDGRELVWVAKAQGSQFGPRYDPDMGPGRTPVVLCERSCLVVVPAGGRGAGARRKAGRRLAKGIWTPCARIEIRLGQVSQAVPQASHCARLADLCAMDKLDRGARTRALNARSDWRGRNRRPTCLAHRGADTRTRAGPARSGGGACAHDWLVARVGPTP